MFIIVESGSTKADWVVVLDDDSLLFYTTEGINPATQVDLLDLSSLGTLSMHIQNAARIYYYGAGVSEEKSVARIKSWFEDISFKGDLNIKEDMLAAARACCGQHKGIVCILGTGSNSCVYDGTQIQKAIPTLGYIINDEGGGCHIGKEILKAYFCGTMPEYIKTSFESHFKINKADVVENLYRSSGANRYLASFARFLTLIEGDWKESLLTKVFKEFIELRILRYTECREYPIYFIGSVAFYHQEILKKTLKNYDLEAHEVLQKPINGLIDYHIKTSL